MTLQTSFIDSTDSDRRWREWQTRGSEADRRTSARTRTMILVIAAALGAWFTVQLI